MDNRGWRAELSTILPLLSHLVLPLSVVDNSRPCQPTDSPAPASYPIPSQVINSTIQPQEVRRAERWLRPLAARAARAVRLACCRAESLPAPLPTITASGPRPLKPRPPNDRPACRAATPPAAPAVAPTPCSQLRSRRGRPKLIPTQGFACPNHAGDYYGITAAAVHALVGAGHHGTAERSQTSRCQACQTTCTARHDTPLYRRKTPAARVGQVLAARAAGLDVAAAARVFGYREATISCWLSCGGRQLQRLHTHRLQNLSLPQLHLDELRTRLRLREQVLWLWVARDPVSKLIPVLHLGARTRDAARSFVHQLRQRLAADCDLYQRWLKSLLLRADGAFWQPGASSWRA